MLANPKQTMPQKIAAAGPICFAFFCGASMTANVDYTNGGSFNQKQTNLAQGDQPLKFANKNHCLPSSEKSKPSAAVSQVTSSPRSSGREFPETEFRALNP